MRKYKINLKILLPIIILALISIITIYSARTYTSRSLGNLTLKQAIWYLFGFLLVIILVKLKNESLYRHTWIFYIIGNVSLLGLLFFATPINNSRCWFSIPGIGSIQPSEFMKIFIMLTLATMIHNFRSDYKNPTLFEEFLFLVKSFLIVLLPAVLTFLQPDTGAVLIYFIIYFCMMFASGIRIRWFVGAFILISIILGSILWLYFYKENIFIKIFGSLFIIDLTVFLIGSKDLVYSLKILLLQLVQLVYLDMVLIKPLFIFLNRQRILFLLFMPQILAYLVS